MQKGRKVSKGRIRDYYIVGFVFSRAIYWSKGRTPIFNYIEVIREKQLAVKTYYVACFIGQRSYISMSHKQKVVSGWWMIDKRRMSKRRKYSILS